jgi:large subunit ribosomal protein L18e
MSKPENKFLVKTLNLLRRTANKYDAPIWKRVREIMEKPKRRRVAVNISKINRYTSDGDIVVVPGKVLGAGFMDHKVVVGAFSYSEMAIKKLKDAGCEVLSIEELVNKYPNGSGVKIIV